MNHGMLLQDYYRMGYDINQKGLQSNLCGSCVAACGFKRGLGVKMTPGTGGANLQPRATEASPSRQRPRSTEHHTLPKVELCNLSVGFTP